MCDQGEQAQQQLILMNRSSEKRKVIKIEEIHEIDLFYVWVTVICKRYAKRGGKNAAPSEKIWFKPCPGRQ